MPDKRAFLLSFQCQRERPLNTTCHAKCAAVLFAEGRINVRSNSEDAIASWRSHVISGTSTGLAAQLMRREHRSVSLAAAVGGSVAGKAAQCSREICDHRYKKFAWLLNLSQSDLNLRREIFQLYIEAEVLESFELAKVEETRKILKKHAKSTALPVMDAQQHGPTGVAACEQLLASTDPCAGARHYAAPQPLPIIPALKDDACRIGTSIAFQPIWLSYQSSYSCSVRRGQGFYSGRAFTPAIYTNSGDCAPVSLAAFRDRSAKGKHIFKREDTYPLERWAIINDMGEHA
ncbi:hypothetical protein DFH09DRAFT_1101698 [Mycena vulgaris]|nr:hypothetical protein DFH09DRAFT_1101698 [Mycena vulgaris]